MMDRTWLTVPEIGALIGRSDRRTLQWLRDRGAALLVDPLDRRRIAVDRAEIERLLRPIPIDDDGNDIPLE